MAASRGRSHGRLAGAARRGARGRRRPRHRWPGRTGLARPGERGAGPSEHGAVGQREHGRGQGSRRRGKCARAGRRGRGCPAGLRHVGTRGATVVRRRTSNHGAAREWSRSRGSHLARHIGSNGGRRWRQHTRPPAAHAHAGRSARPADQPGTGDRRVATGARGASDGRSSQQGPGLPTQAVAGATACRYSFHTSTETSSTGRGIGGSGLAALTRTLSAP
jgi:hypothetical protein